MSSSLSSSFDVIKLFPSKLNVSNNNMVPTLVYSGSRNRTMAVLEAIDRARETPGQLKFANSTCARRFHSCTGNKDKEKCIEGFANGKFPLISCTMALGLGQNWKRVRAVAHMERGDPASIGQMIGQCGRDGKPGLAVLFVEKNQPKGKNQVGHFKRYEPQSDLDRMDALAVTPLCLRVAFEIDNMQREAAMPLCDCSNCAPTAATTLMDLLLVATKDNFDDIMENNFVGPENVNLKHKYPPRANAIRKQKFTEDDKNEIEAFTTELSNDLHIYYDTEILPGGTLHGADLFDSDDCVAILSHLALIVNPRFLQLVIGAECFKVRKLPTSTKITHQKGQRDMVHLLKRSLTASKAGLDGRIQVNSGYGHPI
ncbi:hypothetical protein PCANC_03362 [Puccinia coronata f. sp. avenae]|uniref:DNA 3'-5' helicase n=1 Tax=Puccinia coronata f. sp. avenae TaxID=200324 RepID=A0A2N5T8Z3_9BASI|nr:hypothetical protein PCANC_03362 [Puccinia coronata f. sp. avenae]